MKKNFIYALIACFTLSLAACSTDPELSLIHISEPTRP